jgi:hypothetical protein
MRSRLLFLLAPLALGIIPITYAGCNTVEQLDNLCLFLKDDQSCYRNFLTDIGEQCTMSTFVGTFDTRDSLSKCTLTDANVPANIVTQVDFDPPIELTQLPYTGGSAKLTINGVQCGIIEFGADEKLSVALDVYPQLTDPEAVCETSATQFCGSSFSNTPIVPESSNQSDMLMNTKCPDGTTFKFDRRQIEQQCPDQAGIVPKAKLVIVPNGVGNDGSVTLSIKYSPDKTLTYVTCKILGQLPLCANGEKDGVETDVDCGGGVCGKCQSDQACIGATDCASGLCAVVAGLKKCALPAYCTNLVKDGTETDVNCGGLCNGCETNMGCLVDADCLSGMCDTSAGLNKCK